MQQNQCGVPALGGGSGRKIALGALCTKLATTPAKY